MAATLYELIGPPTPEKARQLLLLLRLAPAQRAVQPKAAPERTHRAA